MEAYRRRGVLGRVGAVIGRIVIADVLPVVSCGQWPAKAVVGEVVPVSATVFREGHDRVGANVVMIAPDGHAGSFVRMRQGGPDAPYRFEAEVVVDAQGTWQLRIEAWADPVATWQHAVSVKAEAGQQLPEMAVDLEDGALLLERAAEGLSAEHRPAAQHAVAVLRNVRLTDVHDRIAPALSQALTDALAATPLRELVTAGQTYRLTVDRRAALFSSWYELFPRSEGASLDPPRSGTFRTAAERLPAVRDMGFDVVYLPPIHPIGEVNRKGPNNTLTPGPDDPGSPWAIGSREGGHDAVHPDLGTIDDFDAFVARAGELGMEVALDLAMQCAPDHPWATEHPEWFTTKSDGSIVYAENPPKKYQDIYPLNFDNDPEGIYAEILRVVRHWTAHGVRLFRVDNPHTKPVQFWERLIAEIREDEPDVLFLAEAFTRAPMMHTLGRVGFTQSYTYFTWRTAKWELEEYGRELVDAAWHMRPNFFVNTPDILHAYLQYGGPPAFKIRAVLASMLSPAWGVYAGYEKYEHVAVRPGSTWTRRSTSTGPGTGPTHRSPATWGCSTTSAAGTRHCSRCGPCASTTPTRSSCWCSPSEWCRRGPRTPGGPWPTPSRPTPSSSSSTSTRMPCARPRSGSTCPSSVWPGTRPSTSSTRSPAPSTRGASLTTSASTPSSSRPTSSASGTGRQVRERAGRSG